MLKLKLILVLLFISFLVKSQVYKAGTVFPYYYDINPDTVLGIGSGPSGGSHSFTRTYLFDIDSDSLADFKIEAKDVGGLGGAARSVNIISLDTNCFVCFGRIDSLYHGFYQYWMTTPMAKPLHFGDSLNSLNHQWKKTVLSILNNSGSAGTYTHPTDWVSTNDLYIGIKYQSLTDTVYGWVRVNCPSIQQCRIKDYSFSKCVNTPYLRVVSSSSVSCVFDSVTISASGADSYIWSTGSVSSSIDIVPAITTTYTVEGINMYGCSTTAMITQSVSNLPSLTVSSSTNTTCASEPVTLNVNGAGSYTWSTGNTDSTIMVSPASTTTYTVEGTNVYGCSAIAIITQSVVTCAGIKEFELYQLEIYPNPVTSVLTIKDNLSDEENTELEITNYLGQVVYKRTYSDSIDVSQFCGGLYTLKITSKNKQLYYSKFIKE